MNYKKRRENLAHQLPENSVVILFSGVFHKKSADSFFPFAVNKNFYYLTGIKQENSVLLLEKKEGKLHETLFILKYNKTKEMWDGKKLTPEEASEISNIKTVLETEQFEALLPRYLKDNTASFLDLEAGIFTLSLETTKQFALRLSDQYKTTISNAYPLIVRLRMVKDEDEVQLIKDSIKLTHAAINEARTKIKAGNFEYDVAALFEYKLKQNKGQLGFETIIASGKNATILHYIELNEQMNDGDLVLLDLGGHNNMYTADISRTYPINGSFSPLQETIYSIVLECNKAVINYIKPGLTLLDLQNYAKKFLKDNLVKANLLNEEDDIASVYYHGVSHHLGLDTHDPGERSLPLAEGNVITVEPGLYFANYGIGVRIEDNILVTKKGGINLSSAIPKEIKDII